MKTIALALLFTGVLGHAHASPVDSDADLNVCREMVQDLKSWIAVKDMTQATYYQDPSLNNKNMRIGLGYKVRALMADVNAKCGTYFAQSPAEADPR